MADYRASLTRNAYERNREKCEKVMQSIIDGAARLDPVCLKIFASSYMTKAPIELLSHQQNDGTHVLMGEILQEMLVSPKKASRETIDFILDIHRTIIIFHEYLVKTEILIYDRYVNAKINDHNYRITNCNYWKLPFFIRFKMSCS